MSKTDARLAPYKIIGAELRRRVPGWADYCAKGTNEAVEKLGTLTESLDSLVAQGDRPEQIPFVLKTMRPYALAVARTVTPLTAAIRVIDEMTNDPAFRDRIGDDLPDFSAMLVDELERARNTAKAAKDAIDRAETALARVSRDADAAEEAWSARVLEVEGLADEAQREAKALQAWGLKARAARDAATLKQLRAARPATPSLQAVSAMNRDTPFDAFHRDYRISTMPKALRDEVQRDTQKWLPVFNRARAAALAAAMLDQQVASLKIDPPDARRGLSVLDLPATLLGPLKSALTAPRAQREKALDTLARSARLPLSGRQMQQRLQKAGVV